MSWAFDGDEVGKPDDGEPITPEWLLAIGMKGYDKCNGEWMDYHFLFTKLHRKGNPVVSFMFAMKKNGPYGRSIKRKVPVFDWMEISGGRVWQHNGVDRRFVPTRGRVRMLLKALGIKTLEG